MIVRADRKLCQNVGRAAADIEHSLSGPDLKKVVKQASGGIPRLHEASKFAIDTGTSQQPARIDPAERFHGVLIPHTAPAERLTQALSLTHFPCSFNR